MLDVDIILSDAVVYRSAYGEPSSDVLVIKDGIILSVLPEIEARKYEFSGPMQSLEGRTIFPGLYDSHIHLLQYALTQDYVNCETSTLEECLTQIGSKAANTGTGDWILGHGWDHNLWSRPGNISDLDNITSQHPVFLTSKSLHSAWGNSLAFQKARITPGTPDPPGGLIERDSHGRFTGILLEEAVSLISRIIPPPDLNQCIALMEKCQELLWRFGLVGAHNFDLGESLRALQTLHQSGKLGFRVLQNVPLAHLDEMAEAGIASGFGDNWLKLGSVKVFMDGALGPHTAALYEPYENERENTGVLLHDQKTLQEIIHRSLSAGFPLAIHAIGDRANHTVLNAFEISAIDHEQYPWNLLPHRIEHAQLLLDEDFARFNSLSISASMQPLHAPSDMLMADQEWGDRCQRAYAWKSLLDRGARLLFGSDAPVESPNPFLGVHAAVTRRRVDGSPGERGWYSRQRLSIHDALQAYTQEPARYFSSPQITGRLDPLSAADLIVLDEDPFRVDPHQLHKIEVVGTMVGGEWRFRKF